MKNTLIVLLTILVSSVSVYGQADKPLKVFISIDMEGVTGVVNGQDVSRSGKDYEYFRKTMTMEANAAIEGALAAGAVEILVRDSHGSKNNLLPEMLHKRAKLLRGVSIGPKNMMEGIDETFDAVIFVAYHAKAGTPGAILEHTSTGNVVDFSINGVSLPEGGYNALIAGLYDVPVVFVSGDRAICEQAKNLFGAIETVAVKEEIGNAAISLHPETGREKIRAGVIRALSNLQNYSAFKLAPPYTMTLKVRNEKPLVDGVRKTGDGEFTFTSSDLLEVIDMFNKMK